MHPHQTTFPNSPLCLWFAPGKTGNLAGLGRDLTARVYMCVPGLSNRLRSSTGCKGGDQSIDFGVLRGHEHRYQLLVIVLYN